MASDSVLLAVNEAGLSLLGAESLAHVLGRQLTEHIHADDRPRWGDFAARVRASGSASLECELLQLSGDRRTVLLQGAALSDHPDGVESIVLAIRDTTAARRLERALEQEGASRQTLEETRAKLEQALADRQRIESQLAEARKAEQRLEGQLADAQAGWQSLDAQLLDTQAEKQRLADALARKEPERGPLGADRREEIAKLQQLVEDQQLALIQKEREHRDLVAGLRVEIAAAVAEQVRLTAALESGAAERTRLEAEAAATRAQVDAAIAERSRLTAALEAAAAERSRLETEAAATRGQLAAAHAETSRLTAALEEGAVERNRLEADRAAMRTELERAFNDERQEAALAKEQSHQKFLDLESRLSAAVKEQTRLAALLEVHHQLEAERDHSREQLERAFAEAREQLERGQAEHHEALGQVEAQLTAALVEQKRLVALLDERDREHQRLQAAHAEVGASLDRAQAEARQRAELGYADQGRVSELEAQLSMAVGEQRRLATLIDERDQQTQRLADEHAEIRGRLERALADAREQLARRSERQQQQLAELDLQLSAAVAEQTRLAAMLAARDTERRRLEADQASVRARLEQARAEESERAQQEQDRLHREIGDLQSKYDQMSSERERLIALATRHDQERQRLHTERQRIEADLSAARTEVERVTREHEHALLIREDEQRELIANLQAELALSMSVQKRLETELSKSEANLKRLVAEHTADRAQAERALGDAIIKKNQILKVLADQRVELQQLSESARGLEPLAAAGRLAVNIGRELQELASEIDTRARFLLSLSALDATYRAELEALRAGAVRAASLSRQFALTNLQQPTIPFEDERSVDALGRNKQESAETL